jgi:hypothetical protein
MNHVERQNQGGHVSCWYVTMHSGNPLRIVARTRDEAVREALESGGVHGACLIRVQDASNALLIARRALAEARTESAKGRR